MTTYTKSDLVDRAMKKLGLIEAQETASSEDYADVLSIYVNLYSEMIEEGKAFWAENEIPSQVIDYLAMIVAELIAPSYGAEVPTITDIRNGAAVSIGTAGWRGLTRYVARKPTGVVTQAEYF